MRLNSCLKAGFAVALMGMSGYGFAAGFALLEQSVKSMGNAYSDATTGVGTASTIAFNPAGLSALNGNSAAIGFNQVLLEFEFENDESVVNYLGSNMLIPGGNGGEAGTDATIPYAFYAYGSGDLTFGLGVYAPFGLATKYEDGWVGRYHGIESAITVLNISPAISYKVSSDFSVGLAVDYQMLNAKLTNAIDLSLVCIAGQIQAGRTPTQASAACGSSGLTAFTDGTGELEGESAAFGANLGFLYSIDANTRLGLSYHSSTNHKIEGDAKFKNIPAALQAGGSLVDTKVSADVTLPGSISLGAAHEYGKDLGVSADIRLTQWQVLDKLEFDYESAQSNSVEEFEWENATRFALGGFYSCMENFVSRFGVAYDQTPIPNKEKRNVRLPDADRTWVTLGGGYNFGAANFDLSVAKLFLPETEIERSNSFKQTIKGKYNGDVTIVGLEANAAF